MGGQIDDQQSPLLENVSSSTDEAAIPLKRTGTVWTAIAHIITGVIGAGVLSLAWSIAQLGWVAGPLSIIIFAAVTIISTYLLCDCYRFPDPEFGLTRNSSFMEAVKHYLGEKSRLVCGIFLHESLFGCGIAYVITVASSASGLTLLKIFRVQRLALYFHLIFSKWAAWAEAQPGCISISMIRPSPMPYFVISSRVLRHLQ